MVTCTRSPSPTDEICCSRGAHLGLKVEALASSSLTIFTSFCVSEASRGALRTHSYLRHLSYDGWALSKSRIVQRHLCILFQSLTHRRLGAAVSCRMLCLTSTGAGHPSCLRVRTKARCTPLGTAGRSSRTSPWLLALALLRLLIENVVVEESLCKSRAKSQSVWVQNGPSLCVCPTRECYVLCISFASEGLDG